MTAFDAFSPLGPPPPNASQLPRTAAPPLPGSDRLDGWWSLLYRGWTLLAPSGVRIDLTEIERACFQCLLRNPNRELRREELMATRASTNLRTLNVAICRLRSKVLRTGIRLPLHTVHGVGYVFLGNLRELSDL
ncbi:MULTISPECIES: helix-turn-helix domain-containing protein [Achromobacter]|uniref:OmpR/PhoB-type domain-containing protein n=2 Tax=Achromobacter piechaudii TaxID=72556 RepID=A0A6S7E099_9BURK|nr:helix-turn-helix domain-containing protein [Achromobacter piechaudii]EFF74305.1 transcriptional regulatory protein, C-terminal domain protein [Achromobacter piechaudii ATCC 43553]MPS76845.1 helix-turn-helix domain-containing protein [Achromobacter sp.]CAB3885793.1 hypothetical protein LMG1861_03515 [Achromobacter piechaudii]